MDDAAIFAIVVVIMLVVMAGIWSWFIGPSSPFAAGWRSELRELEVKVRMNSGETLIDDLRAMASLQRKLGKRWDAESTLRRALHIAEQQWGKKNPNNRPVQEDLAALLDSMHRRDEAKELRRQISQNK